MAVHKHINVHLCIHVLTAGRLLAVGFVVELSRFGMGRVRSRVRGGAQAKSATASALEAEMYLSKYV